tara:strand:+ start:6323 stop:7168 length:846 start_codon:yes stop_codon:yes gene_type:complete
MSNFGQAKEAGEGFVNKLYTGVENFKVTHVNPNQEALKAIYGESAKVPVYTSVDDKGNRQVRVDIYVDNDAAEGEPSIKTKTTFFITEAEKLSQTGKKLFINAYGQTAWLPLDGSIPDAMGWYDLDGSRPAFAGEENLIGFIRNILNLTSVAKAENKADAASQFSVSDWTGMFTGSFGAVQGAMTSPNKIGLLLGVKTTDEGKMYQDVYTRNTLRQWAKESGNFDYLRNDVTEAQNNGAYSKTVFGSPDYKLREFTANEAPTDEGLFSDEKSAPASSFFQG